MLLEQLDLFGNPVSAVPLQKEKLKAVQQPLFAEVDEPKNVPIKQVLFIEPKTTATTIDLNLSKENNAIANPEIAQPFVYSDGNIRVKIKAKPPKIVVTEPVPIPTKRPEPEPMPNVNKRGRKSYKDLDAGVDLINIPDDETLSKKLYYGIAEVANWFNVNVSQIRFWENEFDILQPRKTKKGDRLFRVEDIKNLVLIYHLVRQRKFSIEGAKAYLKSNKKNADTNFELVQSLTKFRKFLLELKVNLRK